MKGKTMKSSTKVIVSPILCVCIGLSLIALIFYINIFSISNTTKPLHNDSNSITILASEPAVLLSSITTSNTTTNIELKIFHSSIPNPHQNSKNAYVTLISGIDESMKYRGFLYNALIMKQSLKTLGSTADFIAMIGFSMSNSDGMNDNMILFEDDLNLLKSHGIIVHILPRLISSSSSSLTSSANTNDTNENQENVSSSSSSSVETLPLFLPRLTFAEMALLKITPWGFSQYDRIQFLDGDIMPTRNMDCFFKLQYNTFTVGAASPLNSGWFLAIPDAKVYEYLKRRAVWRLSCDWDSVIGWKEPLVDFDLTFRGGSKKCNNWDFNGADMDQGLFTHYFLLNYGLTLLIDTDLKEARFFEKGLKNGKKDQKKNMMVKTRHVKDLLNNCHSNNPTLFFTHFTGKNKPWIIAAATADKKRSSNNNNNNNNNPNYKRWMVLLDELHLSSLNSTHLLTNGLNLGSPLGYYNADMNKQKYARCIPLDD